MAGPRRLGGDKAPEAEIDPDAPEVSREEVDRERRREREEAAAIARADMTRRSWYTRTAAVDRFQNAVDDIHYSTRVPKHEVVAALLEAAADQADRVGKRLARQAGGTRPKP